METLLQDVGYGFRMVRKSRDFTTVVFLTLGFGVGANTALFSMVDAVLLRPLICVTLMLSLLTSLSSQALQNR